MTEIDMIGKDISTAIDGKGGSCDEAGSLLPVGLLPARLLLSG